MVVVGAMGHGISEIIHVEVCGYRKMMHSSVANSTRQISALYYPLLFYNGNS